MFFTSDNAAGVHPDILWPPWVAPAPVRRWPMAPTR